MIGRMTVLCSLVCASAVCATVAVAAEMMLPVWSGTATEATGTGAASRFTVEGGASITCSSGSGTFTFKSGSRNLGSAQINLSRCTQGGEPCYSLGSSQQLIEIIGEWHLVLETLSASDKHLILILVPKALHVECPKAAVKLFMKEGDLLAGVAAEAGSRTKYDLSIKDGSEDKGPQEFTKFENNKGEGITTSFTVTQEGGKPKNLYLEGEDIVVTFPTATEIEK